MDEREVKEKLRTWIIQRSKQPKAAGELTDDTPIIESGFLSSLDIVEFVLYIEDLRGEEIELDDLEPAVFTSTNTMYQTFFAQSA
ncbi:MAG: acyl carrier protein [Pseudomonadales bacterium]|nr:acyl carrier protein [Pseudomonadales bacterium]